MVTRLSLWFLLAFATTTTAVVQPSDDFMLSIRNNPHMKTIEFPSFNQKVKIQVRGNPKMDKSMLDTLRQMSADGSVIQEVGECGFSELRPVTNVSQLDECTLIGSQVEIKGAEIKTISQEVKHVDGCIRIENTELENLSFLRFAKEDEDYCPAATSFIQKNPKLCLTPREDRVLKNNYKATIKDNSPNCDQAKVCESGSTPFSHLVEQEYQCVSYKGDINWDGVTNVKPALSKLKTVTDGSIVITKTNVAVLDLLPVLENVTPKQAGDFGLIIRDNSQLTDIKLSPNFGKVKVSLRGNPLLSQQAIDNLTAAAHADSDIQDFGECTLSTSVDNVDMLKDCRHIGNDLNITSTLAVAEIPHNVTAVGGCINIKGSSLKNLDFLRLTDDKHVHCPDGASEISDNKDLCILPRVKALLERKYKAVIKNNMDPSCAQKCEGSTLKSDYARYIEEKKVCEIVTGDTSVLNENGRPAWFDLLKEVHTIEEGRIIIKNNDLDDLSIFPKLKEIKNSDAVTGTIIEVSDNANMNKFDLPLTTIISPKADKLVEIKGSPNYKEVPATSQLGQFLKTVDATKYSVPTPAPPPSAPNASPQGGGAPGGSPGGEPGAPAEGEEKTSSSPAAAIAPFFLVLIVVLFY